MNPNLKYLHAYPFEKLAQLKSGIVPPIDKPPIVLSIGEPGHDIPPFIHEALAAHLEELAKYPGTKGLPELRLAIAIWLARRFHIPADFIDPETQILPVSGTREALFSFAQCVIDTTKKPVVIMPNPFYQIYEGAALLAGAEPYYLNTLEESGYLADFDSVPEEIWQRCQLIYICSPGNPSGSVISQASHEKLINLAEKHDFVIASDECYSELYDDESNPPAGLLQTAFAMGNSAFRRCVVFHSLSKRSNAPGLRSGFVAGDAEILKPYFQYRTYHGCAMPLPTQHASIMAWHDETHVQENRQHYRDKFTAFLTILADVCTINKPAAGFYVWLKIPRPSASSLDKGELAGISDTEFAQRLFAQENVTVLPGSYLSRESAGINPGMNHVRIALVAPLDECIKAAHRIKNFLNTL
ncbi:N-succinyldiaminopimelate aminotransferase [Candidatus Methylobacter favarea]|uniref:N-succinyldiaminopimelate aminotransferase n=1 Tax=Candidatus Methylobacter favarea TaxID=2707345 RepID=A0A8S0XRQ0_9GAMM|nr:succinyldiaminopimelate transaminase [Candidatus Methylobacter favarea]CAA9890159.1 N-succinyldiaminopimelate aminotransferase [Candidatus Methylobacter favarea]